VEALPQEKSFTTKENLDHLWNTFRRIRRSSSSSSFAKPAAKQRQSVIACTSPKLKENPSRIPLRRLSSTERKKFPRKGKGKLAENNSPLRSKQDQSRELSEILLWIAKQSDSGPDGSSFLLFDVEKEEGKLFSEAEQRVVDELTNSPSSSQT
jgi:hypothetical protein